MKNNDRTYRNRTLLFYSLGLSALLVSSCSSSFRPTQAVKIAKDTVVSDKECRADLLQLYIKIQKACTMIFFCGEYTTIQGQIFPNNPSCRLKGFQRVDRESRIDPVEQVRSLKSGNFNAKWFEAPSNPGTENEDDNVRDKGRFYKITTVKLTPVFDLSNAGLDFGDWENRAHPYYFELELKDEADIIDHPTIVEYQIMGLRKTVFRGGQDK